MLTLFESHGSCCVHWRVQDVPCLLSNQTFQPLKHMVNRLASQKPLPSVSAEKWAVNISFNNCHIEVPAVLYKQLVLHEPKGAERIRAKEWNIVHSCLREQRTKPQKEATLHGEFSVLKAGILLLIAMDNNA